MTDKVAIFGYEVLYDYLYCTKNSISFVKLLEMKNNQRLMAVTELEADLIETARNYVKSYPDGYPELLWYAQELFDELVEVFKI